MGFSNKYLEKVRKIGRKVVLPSDEIKHILESRIDFKCVESVCDFGAGSLFWSEYFAEKLSVARIAYKIVGGIVITQDSTAKHFCDRFYLQKSSPKDKLHKYNIFK